jgi:tetratricopeptide (TPR) repeat protein
MEALDLADSDAEFDRALQLRNERRYDEALDVLQTVIAAPLAPKKARRAFSLALTCEAKLNDWPGLEGVARQAIAGFPDWGEFPRRLGEALMRQGRLSEAQTALQRAIELNSRDQEAPLLLELCRPPVDAPESPPARIRQWPGRAVYFENPRELIRRFVLGRAPKTPMVEPDDVFVTLGSCFAQNLGLQLREMGRKVHAQEIGEDVNSTYANRYLLEWIESGPVDVPTQAIEAAYGPLVREEMRSKIAESDVFVITLGVSPCFFRKDTGEFALVISKNAIARQQFYSEHVMRTTGVAENVENLRRILAAVTRLARRTPKFVLTVSPVPLGGTTERESAVVADCVSKSILRVAADVVCATESDRQVVYWPSFEIVRWLAPFFGADQSHAFGAEDGNTRHVSAWLVQLIVELFLEHHARLPAQA